MKLRLVTLAFLVSLTCPRIAHSQPSKLACIAANESAQDLRREGKLGAARAKLVECVAAGCPGPVREDCAQRLADVDAATPTLVVEAKDAQGRDRADVRVTLDGRPWVSRLDGVAIPVDPGEHTFGFDADGATHVSRSWVLREGDKGRRERVVLETPTTPRVSAEPTAVVAPMAPAEPTRAVGSGRRIVALGLGGVGIVGLGVGAVLAFVAKSTYDHALADECHGSPAACSAGGTSDGHAAHDQATAATIALAAGAALTAGGAILYFTAPRLSVNPAIGFRSGGVVVGTTW